MTQYPNFSQEVNLTRLGQVRNFFSRLDTFITSVGLPRNGPQKGNNPPLFPRTYPWGPNAKSPLTYIKYVTYTSYVAPMMTTNSVVNIKPRGGELRDGSQCPNIRLEVNSCPSEKSSHVRTKVKVTMHQKRGTKEKCNIKEVVRRENSVSTSLESIKLNQTLGVLRRKRQNCKCVVRRLQ